MAKIPTWDTGEDLETKNNFLNQAPDAPTKKKVVSKVVETKIEKKIVTVHLDKKLWKWAMSFALDNEVTFQSVLNNSLAEYKVKIEK